MNINAIREVAARYQANTSAKLGFAFRDLSSGETIDYFGNEPFPTASAYKIYILGELFRKVAAGECALSDRLELTDEIKSAGSGVLALLDAGLQPTLKDWATLMMILSDNTATDALFEFCGRDNIRRNVINALGLVNTKCDWGCSRLLELYYEMHGRSFRELLLDNGGKMPSYHASKWYQCTTVENNQTSPLEAAKYLELLYRGEWVNKETSEGMLAIMKECQTNSRIPKYIPPHIEIAHKTGSMDKLCVDLGIVYAEPKGAYIICMFYNGNLASRPDYEKNYRGRDGDDYLADLSKEIYDAYMAD